MTDNPSLRNIPRDSDAFKILNKFAQTWYRFLQSLHFAFMVDKSAFGIAIRLMRECRGVGLATMITEMHNSGGKVEGPAFERPIDLENG